MSISGDFAKMKLLDIADMPNFNPCCKQCNLVKRAQSQEDFMNYLKRITKWINNNSANSTDLKIQREREDVKCQVE